MRIERAQAGNRIDLGKRGENLARCIRFDISDWQKNFGDGIVQLVHKRNGDTAPYPCVITVNGSMVDWPVTSADVDFTGVGQVELQYFVGETLAKSATYTTRVGAALEEAGDPPAAPEAGWVQEVLTAGAAAESGAKRAAASALSAETAAETARVEADRAEAGKVAAANAAEYAKIHADISGGQAVRAETAASQAAESAQNTMDAQAGIETMVSEAKSAEEGAKNAVSEAAAKAAAAESSAQLAGTHADSAADHMSSAESAATIAQQNANAAMNFAADASGSAAAAQGAASAAADAASAAASEASERIAGHNASEAAHADIRAEIAEIKKQIENTVAVDISTAVRMVAEFLSGDTALEFNAHNGSMILCAAEANEATFTDRNGATKYLIPIPETATKVTVKTDDTQVTMAQFIGVNGSDGSYTKAFSSNREAVYSYEFEKGSAKYVAIDLIYEDTAAISVPWEYDAADTTTVTFTLAAEQGVTSWNDLTEKPFGETTLSSEMNFAETPADTFDVAGYSWWKVSDLTPTTKQLLTADIAVGSTNTDGENIYQLHWTPTAEEVITETETITGVQSASYGTGFLVCRAAGEQTAEFSGYSFTFTVPSAGVYFGYEQGASVPASTAVAISYEEIKLLDAKYLPMDAIRAVVDEVISEALEGEY